MLKINEASVDKYIQDKNYVLDYVAHRGIKDDFYKGFIKENVFAALKNNSLFVDGVDYGVKTFFYCSKCAGYDIVKVNENLARCDSDSVMENHVAIGAVWGDDVICMNIKSGEIFLWLIETGEWELVKVSENFKSFLNRIKCI